MKINSLKSDLRSSFSKISHLDGIISFKEGKKLVMDIIFKKSINRSYVKMIQRSLISQIDEFREKYDFNIILSKTEFSNFQIKMSFDLIDLKSKSFDIIYQKFGLSQSIVGKEFLSHLPSEENVKCVVIGVKPRCHKYPFLITKNGKMSRYGSQTLIKMAGGIKSINRMINLDSLLED